MLDVTRPGLDAEYHFWYTTFQGKNSWMSSLLDPVRRTNCVPKEVLDILKMNEGKKIKAIDIGCGPVSVLQALEDDGRIELRRVDPLAKYYGQILQEFKVPLPAPEEGEGETLIPRISPSSFDLVFMRNCLDHTRVPSLVLMNVAALLQPKGFFVLVNKIKEGTNANWAGLHGWDIYPCENTLMGKQKEGVEADLLAGLPLSYIGEMSSISEAWFTFVFQRD